jgi:hypothetical protein
VLAALKIVRPETVIRWHRAGFRAYWRWKSRPRSGRPKTPLEIRQLIREISLANPLWGAPARGGRAAARQDGVEVRAHLRRLVPHIRTRWHKTRITFRGDGHYARPEAMTWCENNGIDHIFGLEGPWIFARAALATFAAQSITERARQNPKYPAGSHPNQQNLFSSIT